MGAERAADRTIAQSCSYVPFSSSAWCHNNFALHISVDLRDLYIAYKNCFAMKYVLRVGRALALSSQEEEKEQHLTHPIPRYKILINLIQFS